MGSGCEILIAANLPSSARQLPILAALHARASTLFGHIIHHGEKKVNRFLKNIDKILSKEGLPCAKGGGCASAQTEGLIPYNPPVFLLRKNPAPFTQGGLLLLPSCDWF